MNDWYRDVSRRRFLQVSAVAGAAVALGGVAAACTTGASKKTGTFNWMTWSDHYYDTQLDEIKKAATSARTSRSWPTTPRASPSSRR